MRVDQPFDLQRLDLPPLIGSILIFGEGDFSYSKSLASANELRGRAHITATSLDSAEYIAMTYDSGEANLADLKTKQNVTILHHIDACVPSSRLSGKTYDSILWNFPYHKSKGVMQAKDGAELVRAFLQTAASILSPSGQIYLTLAQRQGGTTREAAAATLGWDIEKQSAETGYDVIEVLPFRFEDFVDYKPKRASQMIPFPLNRQKHMYCN